MTACQIFTEQEQDVLRQAGAVLRGCLDHTAVFVRPGITTAELDRHAEEFIRSHKGASPAFKGYNGYPATLCTSVNEECVHGIPGKRILQEGDVVSLDCGVAIEGLNTDACITVPVGKISEEAERLLSTTKAALDAALAIVREGVRVGDISAVIQSTVEAAGLTAVLGLTGHGLGRTLHQFPDIPNRGTAGTGPALPAFTFVAIEPIVSAGADRVHDSSDGWTLSIADGALSAHFEHCLFVTPEGNEVVA